MNDTALPTRAYDLLDHIERQSVDNYVQYAIELQHQKRERIIHALYKPIPTEYIRRSRDALYKPLLRAAVAERIKEAAAEQDVSPDRVISEHAKIAFSNISDFVESSDLGEFRVKNIKDMSPELLGAVKSIESKPGMYGMQTKITLHDKHPSLKAMGEMMGLVSPDRPPPLLEYVKPPQDVKELTNQAPEKLYTELLEHIGG